MAIRYSAHRTPKTPYEQSTAPQSSKISPHNISPQSPSSDQSPYNSTTIPVHSSDSTTPAQSTVSPAQSTISATTSNGISYTSEFHIHSTSNAPAESTVSKSPPIYTISPTPHSKSPPKSPHSTSNAPKRRSKHMHQPFGAYNNDEFDAVSGFGYNACDCGDCSACFFKYGCIHCNIAAELPSNVNTTCLFCGENRPDCGQVASEDLGHQIEEAQLGDLARCGKMAITKDDTIILNGMGHKDDIHERLGNLSGGSSEVEVNDR
eukprot:13720_1